MFYEQADALLGICRDVSASSSRTLTLDLTHYDSKEEIDDSKSERDHALGKRTRDVSAVQDEDVLDMDDNRSQVGSEYSSEF